MSRMNPELRQVLERIGWDDLYEAYIQDLSAANQRGERICRSPFPDTHDHNPSFTVNVLTGLWYCFKTKRGGNFVQFRATMEATEFDEATGLAIIDVSGKEREMMEEYGVASPVTREWVDSCVQALAENLGLQHLVGQVKPWNFGTLRLFNVGYDEEANRIIIPVHDRAGKLVNARMYRPGGEPKFIWRVPGLTGNFLFPHCAWREPVVILVEGEPDVLSLRSLGFSAASGTMGAGNPVPEGFWWRNKHVYVWADDDPSGDQARLDAVRLMRNEAGGIRVVRMPDWEGKPHNADASDLIRHLRAQGFDDDGIRSFISRLLEAAEEAELPNAHLDAEAIPVAFAHALSGEYVGQRVEFTARVSARSEQNYYLPTVYEITCPAQGHGYCQRCPMRNDYHGHSTFHHDPRSPASLKLIKVTQSEQLSAVKELQGIPTQCPDPTLRIIQQVNVEPVILNASLLEADTAEEVSHAERQRREAYVIVGDIHLEENRDYVFSGFPYPYPKSQSGVFLLDQARPRAAGYEEFELSDELRQALTIFQPGVGQPVFDKLVDVCQDLASSVTGIRDRLDLHLAYRTVYHSCLRFPLGGTWVDRGWIELLVLGDTRCGKSKAFRQMTAHYDLGLLVDCKLQSIAGILGAVVNSQQTGERYVVGGIYPQQDGRIVCLDEFQSRDEGKASLIEALSSTRAEGIVRISKAASAQFHARVRSIWLANPGRGKLISELGVTGVELIQRLIRQPEDIARFDFALTVTQEDVDPEVLNRIDPPTEARYPRDLARALLLWTYSRRPEQIEFTPAAQDAVIALAKAMYERYDSSIPLVEPADQRTRVAKVAVSIAAQCFSCSPDGQRLIVGPEHVQAAARLFQMWFDKPAMGYGLWSQKVVALRSLADEAAIRRLFEEVLAPHGETFARNLIYLDEFTERSLVALAPVQGMVSKAILQTLYANRAVTLSGRGRRESYELTAPMIAWLRRYLAEKEAQKSPN
jgi:hypothetical protein